MLGPNDRCSVIRTFPVKSARVEKETSSIVKDDGNREIRGKAFKIAVGAQKRENRGKAFKIADGAQNRENRDFRDDRDELTSLPVSFTSAVGNLGSATGISGVRGGNFENPGAGI